MRTTIIGFTACCLSTPLFGQEFIPNNSFESFTSCPTGPAELSVAAPWISPTLATSDYFNACNTTPDSVGVPDNGVGSQEAFDVDGYAGVFALSGILFPDYREYLQSALLGELQPGKTLPLLDGS